MYKFYWSIFNKSIRTIKKEPIILLPYLIFQILINIEVIKLDSVSMQSLVIYDWIIPALILDPIIILMTIYSIKNYKFFIGDIYRAVIISIVPLFLITLLYKPYHLYSSNDLC